MKRTMLFFVALSLMLAGCEQASRLSKAEKALISGQDSIMRVLTIMDNADSLLLRTPSEDFRIKDISREDFAELSRKLVCTVQDTLNPGVGIAGPQVGLLRRVVAVCRYDKPGRPFEVYPNVRIVKKEGKLYSGPEGCLSVPDRRGSVPRYHYITITYIDPESLQLTRENIQGYTAIIFQHEVDHLDGVLYTDYLQE